MGAQVCASTQVQTCGPAPGRDTADEAVCATTTSWKRHYFDVRPIRSCARLRSRNSRMARVKLRRVCYGTSPLTLFCRGCRGGECDTRGGAFARFAAAVEPANSRFGGGTRGGAVRAKREIGAADGCGAGFLE